MSAHTAETKTARPEKPRRLFYLGLGLLILSAVVGLVALLEWLAGWWVVLPSELTLKHTRLHHTNPPRGRFVERRWARDNPRFPQPVEYRYNSQGWRESREIARRKPPRTWRIFYVGDSFTEGCVPEADTVPRLLEQALNRRFHHTGWRFQVINTGTSSYSPLIYYVLVRYYLAPYSPDVVVVNVDMTDDYDDWKYRRGLIVDEAGDPWAVPGRDNYKNLYLETQGGHVRANWLTRLTFFLYRHSRLYILFRQKFEGLKIRLARYWRQGTQPVTEMHAQGQYTRWAWCRYQWDEFTRQNVAFTLDVLRRLGRWCRRQGIRLVLTGVPHYRQFAQPGEARPKWSDRPHREIARVAREVGAVYLDSLGGMRPHVVGTAQADLYYAGDMHFNPRGNRLWAQVHIAAFLDPNNHLLPPSLNPEKGE